MVRRMVLGVLAVCLLAQVAAAATGRQGNDYWSDAGYGTLAVVTNLIYMPAKLLYAGVGTLTGGLAYLVTVGDTDAANRVWSPSVGGTYIVTPAMLRGDEPILFSGASYSGY
ncbi:MAG: hypothetical protein ACE5I7_02535 [Candidatus Binatia bacterium]